MMNCGNIRSRCCNINTKRLFVPNIMEMKSNALDATLVRARIWVVGVVFGVERCSVTGLAHYKNTPSRAASYIVPKHTCTA